MISSVKYLNSIKMTDKMCTFQSLVRLILLFGYLSNCLAISSPSGTVLPPTIATNPKLLEGENFFESVTDNQKFQLESTTSSLVFKQTSNPEATTGHFTIIPPAGHGLIAVVQSLSLRIDTTTCATATTDDKQHAHSYSCSKCIDFIKFSSSDKNSSETCGFLTYKKAWSLFTQSSYYHIRSVMYRGDISFATGIDQELVINIFQQDPERTTEYYSADSSEFPILEVVVTVYKEVCSTDDKAFKRCPVSAESLPSKYCISREVFCDEMANCPPYQPSKSSEGLGLDEKDCKIDSLTSEYPSTDLAEGYDIKNLTLDDLIQTNGNGELVDDPSAGVETDFNFNENLSPNGLGFGASIMVDQSNPGVPITGFSAEIPLTSDYYDEKSRFIEPTATSSEDNIEESVINGHIALWLLVLTIFLTAVYYITKWWFKSQRVQLLPRQYSPVYQKLEIPIVEEKKKRKWIETTSASQPFIISVHQTNIKK